MPSLILLSACQGSADGDFSREATGKVEVRTSGLVIDQAKVLTDAEEQAIDRLAREVGSRVDRKVLVLTIPPLGRQSIEHFGWAVNGQRRNSGTVMLMVSPDTRSVRIEGGDGLTPEQAATIAAAMRPGLAAGQVGPAIVRGLRQVPAAVRPA